MRKALSQASFNGAFFLTDPMRFCLRVVAGVTLSVLIAFLLHLDDPYWAAYPIAAVMSIYRGSTVLKTIERIVATVLGGLVAYFLAALTINHFSAMCLAMVVFITINTIFFLKSNRPYIFLLANITGALILGASSTLGDETFNLLFWRVSTNTVAILSLLVVSALVFPKDAKQEMTGKIYHLLNGWYELSLVLFNDPAHVKKALDLLKKKIDLAKSHYANYSKELGDSPSSREAAQQIFILFENIYQQLKNDENFLKKAFDNQKLKSKLPSLSLLWTTLLKAMNSLEAVLHKKEINFDRLELRERLDECVSEFEEIRQSQYEKSLYTTEEMRQFHFLMNTVQYLVGEFFNIDNLLRMYLGLEKRKKTSRPKLFVVENIDWLTVKRSVRVGVSFVLSFLLWLLTNWPGGLQGLVSVCVLGTEKYFDDVLQKAKLRIIGCVLGGGIGLLCLYFFRISIYNIFFLIAIFMGIFSYINFKSEKYSYVGFQANLAFAIAIIQPEYSPHIGPALERLSGIVIGILATLVVGLTLWPMFPAKIIARLLPKVCNQFSHVYHGVLFGWGSDDEMQSMNRLRILMDEVNESLKSRLQAHGEQDSIYCRYKRRVNVLNQLFQILIIMRKNIDFDRVKETADRLNVNMSSLSEVLCEHIAEGLEHYIIHGKKIKATYKYKIAEYEEIIHDELLKIRHSKKSLEVGREKIAELNDLLYKYDAVFSLLTQRSVL